MVISSRNLHHFHFNHPADFQGAMLTPHGIGEAGDVRNFVVKDVMSAESISNVQKDFRKQRLLSFNIYLQKATQNYCTVPKASPKIPKYDFLQKKKSH